MIAAAFTLAELMNGAPTHLWWGGKPTPAPINSTSWRELMELAAVVFSFLSGLMVVFTLYYMVARHLYLIFISIFLYQFIFQNQYLLFLLNLIEFISIFFRILTLPNRLSLNLFSGNLLITIFIFPLIDHSLIQLIY